MRKFKLFLSLLMVMALSLGNVWATPVSATMSNGTNCTSVTINSGSAIKVGTSKADGSMTITVGAGATKLLFYASAWKGNNPGNITLSAPSGVTVSPATQSLISNDNVTGSFTDISVSPEANYLCEFTLSGVTSETAITVSSGSERRFAVWGAKYDVASSCTNTITITKGAETNGTYTLSATEVCGDGEGEDVTISDITPDPGYAFDKITTSASGTVDNVNMKVTGITANTTITVLFKELQKYTVSFNIGAGAPAQADITEASAGAGITLPAGPTPTCSADGWTFAGWAAEAVASETTSAPTLLSGKYNPTDDVTLYAVYKRTEEGGGSETKYVVAELNSLTGSDVFVIVGNNGKNYAMTNDNGTSSAPGASEITITAGEITSEVADNFKWNISGNSTDGYTFYPNGDNTKWLYATNTNNGVRVGTNDNKAFEIKDAYLYNKGTTRYVGVYNSADWRCYTTINSNIENQTFAFYKATEVSASTTYYLSAPSCVPPQPGVSVDPAAVAFGDVKQHSKGALSTEFVFKNFTVTGENLTGNITVNAPEGSIFELWNPETESVIGTSIDLTPDANKAVEKELAIMAATGWDGAQNGSFTITGGGLAEDVTVNITMNVTPTFEVAVAVNDGEMGTATINGQSALYTDGNDVLNLVATPKAGYEFVNWTVSDGDVLGVASATSATTTVSKATAEGTITANFKAQACTNLAAPTLDEVNTQVTYEYANLAWTAVANAETYAFVVTKHGESTPHVSSSTGNTSTMILNLDANTQYDYSVMAKGDGSTYCDENNALLEGSFTTAGYPAATLTLSENGVERAFAGDHKLKDVVTLPTEVETGVVGKVFVGWSSVEIAETDIKPAYLEPGAEFTFNATSNKLYAVYATETPGEATNHDVFATTSLGTTSTVTDGYTISAAADKKDGYYQDGSGDTRYVQVMVTETATQIIASEPSAITVKATIGGGSAKDPLDNSVYAQFLDASGNVLGDPVVVTTKVEVTTGKEYVVSMPVANYANVRGVRISHVKESGYNVRYYAISLAYTTAAASTYSNYITNGPRLLAEPTISLAAGTYTTAQNVELTAAEGDIYYTLDGTEPTSESDKYTAAIELNKYGEYTLKAIAIDGDNKSNVVSAEYSMKVPFATVDELIKYVVDNKLTSLTNVTVTGIISQIDNFTNNTITYWISDNGQTNAFEVYKGKGHNGANFDAITDLTVGDQVTVNGNYTYFEPAEGDPIHEFAQFTSKIVERTAAEVTSVVISGTATKTEYFYNEKFLSDGLTATAIYNTGYEKDVTSEEGLVWSATPEKVTATGNVNVTATYGGKTSDAKVVAVTKQLRELTNEEFDWTDKEDEIILFGHSATPATRVIVNTHDLPVSYSSNDENIMTVNETTGEITAKAVGSASLSVSFAGNEEYQAANRAYNVKVYGLDHIELSGEAKKAAYEYADLFEFAGLTATAVYTLGEQTPQQLDVTELATWNADPKRVYADGNIAVTATWQEKTTEPVNVAVTVNTYKVTIVQPDHGTLVVKYSKDGTKVTSGDELVLGTQLIFEIIPETNYKAGKVVVNNKPIDEMVGTIGKMDYVFSAKIIEKEEAGIAWSKANGSIEVKDGVAINSDLPEFSNPNELAIEFSAENTDVAEVNSATGEITPKAFGTTKIYATFYGNNDYKAAQVSYDLNVEVIVPEVKLAYGIGEDWSQIQLTPNEDYTKASIKVNFAADSWPNFKIIVDGGWRGNGYEYKRDFTGASEITENGANMYFHADFEGEYTFTWTYATNAIEIGFPDMPESKYYIAGDFTSWETNMAEMTEDAGMYKATVTINATEAQKFKVVRVQGPYKTWYGLASEATMTPDNCANWIIGGGNTDIGLQLSCAGKYTFYFVPEEMKLSIDMPTVPGTALDNTEAGEKAVKVMKNGQLMIMKNGKTYNAQGQIIK